MGKSRINLIFNYGEITLENTTKDGPMSAEQEKTSTKENTQEVWSSQERETSKSRYGCEILQEKCTKQDAKNKQLPVDSYLVTYMIDGNIFYDIIRASKTVNIFDMYYDKFGNCLKSMEWTDGRISPRLWGYKAPEKKKRK
jgi:hypothetical protein